MSRFARTHGPFVATDVAHRFTAPVERIEGAIAALAGEERVVLGEFRPEGVQREWCDVNVLRQLRRRSLAVLRKEVEPVEQDAFGRFLPAWHSIPAGASGHGGARRTRSACWPAPRSSRRCSNVTSCRRVWSATARRCSTNCARRVRSSGRVPDRSAPGTAGSGCASRIRSRCSPPGGKAGDELSGPVHEALRTFLAERGASFWGQLREAVPDATDTELLVGLWDLDPYCSTGRSSDRWYAPPSPIPEQDASFGN